MKISLSITLFFIITLSIVKAQKFTRFHKPIIDLNSKPQVTSPKLPEERRKLSIFPKSMVKYVVTSKPYAKVRDYSPYQVTTKRPVMQQLNPKAIQNTMAATKAPIMKYTTLATTTQLIPKRQLSPKFQFNVKPPVTQIPKDTDFYESEEDQYMEAPSSHFNIAYSSENNLSSFDEKDYVEESDGNKADKQLSGYNYTETAHTLNESIDLDAVESNKTSTLNVNKPVDQATKEEDNKSSEEKPVTFNNVSEDEREEPKKIIIKKSDIKDLQNEEIQNADTENAGTANHDADTKESEFELTDNKELENNRKKRLSVLGRGVYNNIGVTDNKPSKEDGDTASEKNDRNEFIFIKDYLKVPVDVKKSPPNYIAADIDESVEIATEITWLEEYEARPARSVNVIEEENLGTTVSGFKFTGREPRVDSDLVFRNINA